jgi:glycosyltransferase involved in cell wall biosynthesis
LAVVKVVAIGMGWFPDRAGGLNRYFRALHEALLLTADLKPQAIVHGPASDPDPSVTVVADDAASTVHRLLDYWRTSLDAVRAADVLDIHFALYGLLPMLARGAGTRVVVHFHGPWADEASVAGGDGSVATNLRRAIERFVYRRADAHVTVSRAFRRLLIERYGVTPWEAHVISPGVDLERFSRGSRESARDQLGVSEGSFVVVCARRLVPRTGVGVLLDAWTAESLPSDRLLLIVGEGPEERALLGRVDRLRLCDRVRFLGRVDDSTLVDAYRAADVAVVPSVALEGFGLVVLEALACGTPVVATSVGGLPEALGGLDRSLVVPPQDPPAIAARLTVPLPAPADCRAWAEAFGVDAVSRQHVELYGRVRSGRRRRTRVVFLDHTARMSGAEITLLRQVPELLDRIDAHVILGEDGPLVQALEEVGVSVEVLRMPRRARTLRRSELRPSARYAGATADVGRYVYRLARRLRSIDPDLVQTNSLKAHVYGTLAARLSRHPVVWHLHDRLSEDYLPRAAVSLMHRLEPFARSVIANSETTRATLRDPSRSVVIPGPVPEAFFDVRVSHDRLQPVVGLVGRIAPWKGQLEFVRAFANAFPHDEARGRIIGAATFGNDEAYESVIEEEIGRRGLHDRITLCGYRDDVPEQLSELSMLVHASTIPEPFGLVVAEAMASGLPVIASSSGGPAELISDRRNGLLVDPTDVDALAAAMRELADDAELRRRLGTTARADARVYAAHDLADRFLAVYGDSSPGIPRR